MILRKWDARRAPVPLSREEYSCAHEGGMAGGGYGRRVGLVSGAQCLWRSPDRCRSARIHDIDLDNHIIGDPCRINLDDDWRQYDIDGRVTGAGRSERGLSGVW